jgi:hypothetical protein
MIGVSDGDPKMMATFITKKDTMLRIGKQDNTGVPLKQQVSQGSQSVQKTKKNK